MGAVKQLLEGGSWKAAAGKRQPEGSCWKVAARRQLLEDTCRKTAAGRLVICSEINIEINMVRKGPKAPE